MKIYMHIIVLSCLKSHNMHVAVYFLHLVATFNSHHITMDSVTVYVFRGLTLLAGLTK